MGKRLCWGQNITRRQHMSEREKQVQFLMTLIGRDHSEECQEIREKIHREECEQRSVGRTIFLLIVLMMHSLVTLGYTTLFWPETIRHQSEPLLKLCCSMGLASVICLLVLHFWPTWP